MNKENVDPKFRERVMKKGTPEAREKLKKVDDQSMDDQERGKKTPPPGPRGAS